jgi:putative transposase
MAKKRYSAEQIINHLRQVEILISQGKTVREASRQIGITEQTCYRWRKEFGGMDVSQARRLKDLEKENQRLKKLVADQALDISILKDVTTDAKSPLITEKRCPPHRASLPSRFTTNPRGWMDAQQGGLDAYQSTESEGRLLGGHCR